MKSIREYFPSFCWDVLPDLTFEELATLMDCLQDISRHPPTPNLYDPRLINEERLNFPKIPLEAAPVVINQDSHQVFRIMAETVFGSQADYEVMRRCLEAQVIIHEDYYEKYVFVDDHSGYQTFCDNLFSGVGFSGLDYGAYMFLKICADLFQVSFRLITDSRDAILVFAPEAQENIAKFTHEIPEPSHTLPPEYKDHCNCKKTFWLSNSYYSGWQMLIPCGTVAYTPNRDLLNQIREAIEDNELLVSLCQNLIAHHHEYPSTRNEDELLDLRMDEMGFDKVPIYGDGNCLLRTESFWLLGHENHHSLMRKLVVRKLRERPERYESLRFKRYKEGPSVGSEPYIAAETWQEYLERISEDFEWGDLACLLAAVDLFSIKLVCVLSYPNLLMRELIPETNFNYGVIYCCGTSIHMDAMTPKPK